MTKILSGLAILVIVALTAALAVFLFNKFYAKQSLELVDDWKNWKKEWSTWLSLIGGSIIGYFTLFPGALIDVWNNLPFDIKSAIPPQYVQLIGLGIALLAVPAKIIKQKRLAALTPPPVTLVEPTDLAKKE